MNATVLNNENIVRSFEEILISLSEKEKNVIERRVGLKGEKETLQSIGNSFSPTITRERVRQIEESGIRKIGRIIKASILTDIQEKGIEFVKMSGGLASRDSLVNYLIKELNLEKDINKGVLETIVQSDFDILKSKQKLGCKIYFYLSKISRYNVDVIHKEAIKVLKKKKDVIEKEELFKIVSENLKDLRGISAPLVGSVLELFDDIIFGEDNLVGLTKWKILNPKTLKDKAVYILKKEGTPMHFVDIANKIIEVLEDNVKINTIHNELIRNEDFVLIGRGIYALREWGFKPGTVLDVISSILEKRNEPMSTEEIVKEVLKIRDVKETTIYMNLQNRQVIERVGRNFYQLKQ
ncbi:hypothetical protein BLD25_02155 [Candidatus Gracilibacteria bacterium GN02-872]|nr:hypothetical protein BLD25_02155 [Candidatus Gracilibacteria bacterium GN02-872]RKW25103.1 MAG: hypothetical protein D8B46_00240 [Candidatus Gracilibacteria bacterium]